MAARATRDGLPCETHYDGDLHSSTRGALTTYVVVLETSQERVELANAVDFCGVDGAVVAAPPWWRAVGVGDLVVKINDADVVGMPYATLVDVLDRTPFPKTLELIPRQLQMHVAEVVVERLRRLEALVSNDCVQEDAAQYLLQNPYARVLSGYVNVHREGQAVRSVWVVLRVSSIQCFATAGSLEVLDELALLAQQWSVYEVSTEQHRVEVCASGEKRHFSFASQSERSKWTDALQLVRRVSNSADRSFPAQNVDCVRDQDAAVAQLMRLVERERLLLRRLPFEVNKTRLASIQERMAVINSTQDPVARQLLQEEYERLAADAHEYTVIVEAYERDETDRDREWNDRNATLNHQALEAVRSTDAMGRLDMNLHEVATVTDSATTPREQLLRLLRMDATKMCLSDVQRATGLTLAERRALHAHLYEIAETWKTDTANQEAQRLYAWFTAMKRTLRRLAQAYADHVAENGTIGDHRNAGQTHVACPLIGNQCPLKTDESPAYNIDSVFPDGHEPEMPSPAISNDTDTDTNALELKTSTRTNRIDKCEAVEQQPSSDDDDAFYVSDSDSAGSASEEPSQPGTRMWTREEHQRFLEALKIYANGPWKLVAQYVGTRTVRQVMTHAQKYRQKMARRMRGQRLKQAMTCHEVSEEEMLQEQLRAMLGQSRHAYLPPELAEQPTYSPTGSPVGSPIMPSSPIGSPYLPSSPTGSPFLPSSPLASPFLPSRPMASPQKSDSVEDAMLEDANADVVLPGEWKEEENVFAGTKSSSTIVCRHCGMVGDHWSLKCPHKDTPKDAIDKFVGFRVAAADATMGSSSVWLDPMLLGLQVDENDISLGDEPLHAGTTMDVYTGTYLGESVAVKRLCGQAKTIENATALASMCVHIQRFDHPHLVRLLGATWTKALDMQIVTPLINHGDLRSLMDVDQGCERTWADFKCQIAIDVAAALAYLHNQGHVAGLGAVTSRHILVDEDARAAINLVRLPCRDIDDVRGRMPSALRWTAPEVIRGGAYTKHSDVFALGVLLSVLATGKEPYHDATNPNGNAMEDMLIARQVARHGLRPSLSVDCPPEITKLIEESVLEDPLQRPSASEIVYKLRAIMKGVL